MIMLIIGFVLHIVYDILDLVVSEDLSTQHIVMNVLEVLKIY
jgi:hypothetical protein